MLTDDECQHRDVRGSPPEHVHFHTRQRASAEACQARRNQSAVIEKVSRRRKHNMVVMTALESYACNGLVSTRCKCFNKPPNGVLIDDELIHNAPSPSFSDET
jgi:hypothetical protein